MTAAGRDAFLGRVRSAVAAGNCAGRTVDLPSRGSIAYQGGGSDPVKTFAAALASAGGQPHIVADRPGVSM